MAEFGNKCSVEIFRSCEHVTGSCNFVYFGSHNSKVPQKRRNWVTPLFKSRDIPLLNNDVTQR